jgi:hypothetical protein
MVAKRFIIKQYEKKADTTVWRFFSMSVVRNRFLQESHYLQQLACTIWDGLRLVEFLFDTNTDTHTYLIMTSGDGSISNFIRSSRHRTDEETAVRQLALFDHLTILK